MSDLKTERLLNLTIALLATKRFLTKSEILGSVYGYQGSPESMDRMFERDKDELRKLGITIEVGTQNQYFEDEMGYRIRPENYSFDVGELSAEELSFISLAAGMWKNQSLSLKTQKIYRKIVGSDPQLNFATSLIITDSSMGHIDSILESIEQGSAISFLYSSKSQSLRKVAPYELVLWRGSWYLLGLELAKNEIRTFKLNRIIGSVLTEVTENPYRKPENFNPASFFDFYNESLKQKITLHARIGTCQELRAIGSVHPHDSEWDLITLDSNHPEELLSKILSYGGQIKIISPEDLRDLAIARLKEKLP